MNSSIANFIDIKILLRDNGSDPCVYAMLEQEITCIVPGIRIMPL